MTIDDAIEQGYITPMYIEEGEREGQLVALFRFLFTWGIVVNMTDVGYELRYCYEDLSLAKCNFKDLVEKGITPTEYTAVK